MSAANPNEVYRILVVDDDEMNRDMLSRRLARRGYDTLVAEDGRIALDVIQREPVDLVMLDIMMPGMSGVEVLRILRQTYGEDELPVIMATAKSDSEDVVESLDLGANDYVTKPLDFPIVLARVKSQLRDKIPARDRARFQAGGSQPAPTSQVIGKYRIEGEIGAGNCGTVFRGEHQALQRPVAVKLLHGAIQGDTETLNRFRQEGISACRVRHPNAVEVLDIGVQPNGAAYLVMELLEGHSLADEMKASGPMSPVRCAEILWPICDALSEAHRKGIIHRDVKPANIFLHRSHQGEVVKVLDFGIAKLVGDAALDQSVTVSGSLVGTPAYLAPERIRDEDYDGRTDVYSLAVTLYQMLTGRLPVGDLNLGPVALAMKHVQDEPRPIRWYRPDLPTTVESLLTQALDKIVENRPTAEEFGQEFIMALGLPLPQSGRPHWPQWPSQPAAPPVPASMLGRLPQPEDLPPERRSGLSDPHPGPPLPGNLRQSPPRQAPPQQSHPQQSQPLQSQPRQAQPQQGHPMQSQPWQGHPMQAQPHQAQPQQIRPQQGHPMQGGHTASRPAPPPEAPTQVIGPQREKSIDVADAPTVDLEPPLRDSD